MSLLSKYLGRQVKKKGVVEVFMWIAEMLAKATKSTKDDALVQKIKQMLKEYK